MPKTKPLEISMGYFFVAPRDGFEPPTKWLTVLFIDKKDIYQEKAGERRSIFFLTFSISYLLCYCVRESKNQQQKRGEYSPIYSPKNRSEKSGFRDFGPEQTRMMTSAN
ncbi:MAG: hypothetical protein FJ121_06435 [Deltaproteobacteria bacterium]|nr:hypothetical protein [Deltaproteobacteria bacterium]